MSGFEVIVRPVVFPNIRPGPTRVLPLEDDPTKGIATIGGGGGKFVGISLNWSVSVSQSPPHKESRRQFDEEKVKQKDEDTGKINDSNYIICERLKRVRLDTEDGPIKVLYADPPEVDNVETLRTDVTRTS